MKKIILIAAFALYGLNVTAQAKIGDNPGTVNANAVLELQSANKGLVHPLVALTGTVNTAPLNAHVAGMVVYNTATTGDVTPGLYVNDGTKWIRLNRAVSNVSAECNGFTGTYTSGVSARTFRVTYTNNSFSSASVTPAIGDLVLSPGSGLTVNTVSPSTNTTINSGATLLVTYTLTGSLSAAPGTTITGTFTKMGLSCSQSVSVANVAPVANAGSAQSININSTTSVSLSGSATDSDGTIASYAWTKTGGTGTATPVITNPSSAATTVTGINAAGTYIFTLTATDNNGATGTATVTITAFIIPEATIGGPSGTTLTFMAHNLGADNSLNPLTPAQGLHGNYYQWGKIAVAATSSSTNGAIAGWSTTPAVNQAWNSASEATPAKTANDPCPAGYRVPTSTEMSSLLNVNGNTTSTVGSFTFSPTNFTSGMNISYGGTPKLFFPAAGNRYSMDGSLVSRGSHGHYYTSTTDFNASYGLSFTNTTPDLILHNRNIGASLKCIKM